MHRMLGVFGMFMGFQGGVVGHGMPIRDLFAMSRLEAAAGTKKSGLPAQGMGKSTGEGRNEVFLAVQTAPEGEKD